MAALIYTYTYTCKYTCKYTWTCIYTRTHTVAYTFTDTHPYTHICIRTCTQYAYVTHAFACPYSRLHNTGHTKPCLHLVYSLPKSIPHTPRVYSLPKGIPHTPRVYSLPKCTPHTPRVYSLPKCTPHTPRVSRTLLPTSNYVCRCLRLTDGPHSMTSWRASPVLVWQSMYLVIWPPTG